MSLITRCPACETMFRVVPDQLRVSEGWVRCGHCEEVFDATAHLIAEPAGIGDVMHDESAALTSDPSPTAEAMINAPSTSIIESRHDAQNTAVADGNAASLEEVDGIAELDRSILAERLRKTSQFPGASNTPSDVEPAHSADSTASLTDTGSLHVPEPVGKTNDVIESPSFLREAPVARTRHSPLRRLTSWVLIVLLTMTLLGQVLVQERDRIVAHAPASKPWFDGVCQLFNCQVSALKQIDAIVIDSSSFTKLRPEIYRLNVVIKNTAITAVAIPSVELSVTDAQDQALIKRVLSPVELGAKFDVIDANGDWSSTVTVSIKSAGVSDRVTGYRLIAFYP